MATAPQTPKTPPKGNGGGKKGTSTPRPNPNTQVR